MTHKYNTLIDRLDDIVDKVHIDEVKQIIATLSKINKFKHSIEDDLCADRLYEKIKHELLHEFKIDTFKISIFTNNIETILFQEGSTLKKIYTFKSKVSNDTVINVSLNSQDLSEYDILSLNSYFSELVQLLYIQFVLTDLQKSTTVDPLTRLQNRISFNNEMKTLIPLAIREKMKIGVLLINIDRFRAVNDEHGDEFGDEFLKLYAKIIQDNIRTSDIAVRFSGGEFLVLLINIDTESRTLELADKIKEKLASSYLLSPNGDHFKKTVCIGVSMFPQDSSDINEIVKNTEMALSDARDSGRNRVLRFHIDEEIIDLF
ncbi:GGDEF domain-containing protein [Arcobacteraceae bacterium]|nr:GGDEF domain-containing protein [Arcobacteraceae bacterium]